MIEIFMIYLSIIYALDWEVVPRLPLMRSPIDVIDIYHTRLLTRTQSKIVNMSMNYCISDYGRLNIVTF